jgi:hypothetical protein
MYAQRRATTIPLGLILGGFLIAGAIAGGAGGYAIATTRASVGGSVTSAAQAAGYDERITTFLASEHQGTAENPNVPPLLGSFRSSERQGSAENPDAAQGPSNTAFLAGEHQGSVENPDATNGLGVPFAGNNHLAP